MSKQEKGRVGGISVETEHIFPIIKKWLYSEKEIFVRELVSNSTDAITKLKRLSSLGQYEDEQGAPYRIDVRVSAADKTITITDNGIGMTADEVERYLGKVALSGALEFIEKYEGEGKEGSGIIGHFGLGFYAAFMVADKVEVRSQSYTNAPAVRWVCRENGSYELFEDSGHPRGTSVILSVNKEGEEYLTEYKMRQILERYCAFMPYEIYLTDEDGEAKKAKKKGKEKDAENEAPAPVNNTQPLWMKNASDCTPEEYKEFYRKVFSDYREPLFYMHLNADYPLNFRGIIYFPKLMENYENLEGKIKLYYNQVFVADNIKEVIPEYLLMLRGVLDCPELPLNVSRSYLQDSGYVSKISAHIVKKVTDKLQSLCTNEREAYERMWRDIKTFVSYACISDKKFYDRAEQSLLLSLADGGKMTLSEYLETAKEKHEGTVYYATDEKAQSQYISLYESRGIRVAIMDTLLDTRLAETIEMHRSAEKIKFLRVDADLSALKGEGTAEQSETLTRLFSEVAGEGTKLTVAYEALQDKSIPAILVVSEQSRRMEDMMRMYAPDAPATPPEATLTLNTSCDIITRLAEGTYADHARAVAAQVYSLALLANRKLSADELKRFLADSYELMRKL